MSYREQPISKDLLDVILQASQKVVEVDDPNGTGHKIRQPEIDPEIIWCKTLMVNSNGLGYYIFDIKELERLGLEAENKMNRERALVFQHTMVDYITSHKRGLDGKSSESMRDKENSQSTLVDKINKTQTEKIYTAQGKVARGVLESFIHQDKQKDDMRD